MFYRGQIFQIKDTSVLFLIDCRIRYEDNSLKYRVEINGGLFSLVNEDFIEDYCVLIGEL